jgi:transcriptional regulator with XRE-family HTH domain
MSRSKEEMLASQRIQRAREALGLSVERVAAELSLGLPWYRDLEANSEEVFSNISLAHLQLLAYALQVEPARILLGDAATALNRRGEFGDVKLALNDKMKALALNPEALSERVGWDVREVLVDSQELWNFTVDGLRDVCNFAEVDWLSVLPGLPK